MANKALTVTIGDTQYKLTHIHRREYSISEHKAGRYFYKRPRLFLVEGYKKLDRDLAARDEFIDFLKLHGVSIPPNFKTWRLI